MAQVSKIDSNITGLRVAEEASIGVLGGSPVWNPLEPNGYNDFGGEISNVARNPINSSRQRRKGVTTDLDASGGFNVDLTQTSLDSILQGFFFADFRAKTEFTGAAITVSNAASTYAATGIDTGLAVGSLVFMSGFAESANNGLKEVTAVVADQITVAETLADETSATTAKLVEVGFQFASGDLEVDASGDLPKLITTTKSLTDFGLIPGEWLFIGGDVAATKFSDPENNAWVRLKTIAANEATIDKSTGTMITDAAANTVRIFFGRVLKNESNSALIKRRSYQLERTLGAPDDAQPSQIQAEYLVGSVANELTFNFEQADKITVDLGFLATDHEQVTGATGVKAGTRPAIEDADAFNTTNDFSRLRMSVLDAADSNPTPLFAFLTDFTIVVNNNVSPNKAISVLGAFDMSAGTFTVSGDLTAYFSDVTAVASVRNNANVTLDFAVAKNNAGVLVDVPLITLGDGRLTVEQDEPITLPLTQEAAADPVFDHTLLMIFFDYLPTSAE